MGGPKLVLSAPSDPKTQAPRATSNRALALWREMSSPPAHLRSSAARPSVGWTRYAVLTAGLGLLCCSLWALASMV